MWMERQYSTLRLLSLVLPACLSLLLLVTNDTHDSISLSHHHHRCTASQPTLTAHQSALHIVAVPRILDGHQPRQSPHSSSEHFFSYFTPPEPFFL